MVLIELFAYFSIISRKWSYYWRMLIQHNYMTLCYYMNAKLPEGQQCRLGLGPKQTQSCVCHNIYVGFWQSNWIESFPSDLHVQAYTDHSLLYYFVSVHASRNHKQTQGLETIFIPNHWTFRSNNWTDSSVFQIDLQDIPDSNSMDPGRLTIRYGIDPPYPI